jgi:hypothetical protein
MIPKLEREVFIGCTKSTDEMVFESLYCPFCGVDSMVVGLNELYCSILLLHEVFDWFGCLIVGDVECGFVPLGGEGFEHVFECLHDVTV